MIAQAAFDVFLPAVESDADYERLRDVIASILDKTGEVWGLPTSALFAQVLDDGDERVLLLGPSAGLLDEILALSDDIDAWARAAGCARIEAPYSRHGWERLLPRLGYECGDGVMRKLLHGS